jgi:hypothetical protein
MADSFEVHDIGGLKVKTWKRRREETTRGR